MKTLIQSENKQLVAERRLAWWRRFGSILLLVGGAAFLGRIVAQERWLLLLIMATVPLVALWPVPLVVGGLVFLIPFDGVAVIGGKDGLAVTFLAGGLAALVLLVTGYLRQRLERPSMTAVWWSLFVAWGALSSLWAIDQNLAINALPTALATLFLYLAAASVRITREELNWIVLATILGGCAAAAYCSLQYYSGVYYGIGYNSGRASLIMGEHQTDPNVFAASLFLPLSLAVGRFFESRGWYRTLYLVMGGLIAVAIMLTMSRGAMLGLVVMVFVYFRRLGLDRRVLIPVAIVLLSLLALPNTFLYRLQTAESSGGAGRLYIWEAGLAALQHYGLFGAGLHNFGQAYTQYVGEGAQVHGFGDTDAHNDYLLIAVELGPVGIGLLGMAVFSALRAGRRLQERLNQRLSHSMVPYEAAALAMLTSSFFVGMLWRKAYWLVWIMYALVLRVASEKTGRSAVGSTEAVRENRPTVLAWPR